MPDEAPGIPDRTKYGGISTLPLDAILTLVRQRHDARRAHLHEDLRLGGPGGFYSYAIPKFLPEKSGEWHLAIPQPVHRYSYKDFEGSIPEGQYGAGTVSKIEESPVVILKNTWNHLMFTRGNTKNSPIYDMTKLRSGNWLVSMQKPDQPPQIKFYKKDHFKSLPIDQVADKIDQGMELSAKIDGAAALAYLGKHGINVYGIRPDKTGFKPEYTDYITSSLRQAKVPEDLQGTVLRTELYGVHNGKVIPPQELSGLLNSTLTGAIDKKQKRGISLLLAALAVNQNGRDNYNADVTDVVNRVKHPALYALPHYKGAKARKLLKDILAGKNALTQEGVVLYPVTGKPIKSKVRPDYDVVVQDVFPAETKSDPRAGGFTYSLPGSDKVVGRVGTGFDHQMLRDMLEHPEAYRGRTARVQAQDVYPSGALRAPSFISMKED